MPVSNNFRTAANAQESDGIYLMLVTIAHDDLLEPIRVTSDTVETISRGDTFIAFHFDLDLPTNTEGGVSTAKLNISNVDRRIVQALRDITPGSNPPTVLIEVVMADDPETLEMALPGFELVSAKYKRINVEGDVSQESFFQEPWPKDTFTPANFPGMFR